MRVRRRCWRVWGAALLAAGSWVCITPETSQPTATSTPPPWADPAQFAQAVLDQVRSSPELGDLGVNPDNLSAESLAGLAEVSGLSASSNTSGDTSRLAGRSFTGSFDDPRSGRPTQFRAAFDDGGALADLEFYDDDPCGAVATLCSVRKPIGAQVKTDNGVDYTVTMSNLVDRYTAGGHIRLVETIAFDVTRDESGRYLFRAVKITEVVIASDDPDAKAGDVSTAEGDTETTANLPPIADAGPDRSVPDADGDGSAEVVLDGTASHDPDGTIISYEWLRADQQIATGSQATVTLAAGVHSTVLKVTDDRGGVGMDVVNITVESPTPTATATSNAPSPTSDVSPTPDPGTQTPEPETQTPIPSPPRTATPWPTSTRFATPTPSATATPEPVLPTPSPKPGPRTPK